MESCFPVTYSEVYFDGRYTARQRYCHPIATFILYGEHVVDMQDKQHQGEHRTLYYIGAGTIHNDLYIRTIQKAGDTITKALGDSV